MWRKRRRPKMSDFRIWRKLVQFCVGKLSTNLTSLEMLLLFCDFFYSVLSTIFHFIFFHPLSIFLSSFPLLLLLRYNVSSRARQKNKIINVILSSGSHGEKGWEKIKANQWWAVVYFKSIPTGKVSHYWWQFDLSISKIENSM